MSDLNIDAKAISDSLKSTLGDWKDSVKDDVVGYVSAIADGVARVKGLENVMASELLEFPGGLVGVALNLEEDSIGVVLMGCLLYTSPSPRDTIRSRMPSSA